MKQQKRVVRALAATLAGVTACAMMAGPAEATQTDPDPILDAVTGSSGITIGLEAVVDLTTGDTTVASTQGHSLNMDNDGNITASTTLPSDQIRVSNGPTLSGTSYTCVHNAQNSNFRAYTPKYASSSGVSYETEWGIHPYSVDKARYVSGYQTFQYELCTTGGGHTMNYYHQWFNGAAITIGGTTHRRIGYNWATQGADDTKTKTTSSLDFQVGTGPVSIGASTSITPGVGDYKGNLGADENMTGYPDNWTQFNLNRVNTFFVSPNNWIWDGTGDFEGNNGHSLYEWNRANVPSTLYTYLFSQMNVFCAKPGTVYGVDCDPL